ncbi:MAG: hypothetical protein Q7R39_12655 [Dehalococcoidia bacterium]|nr:hypothetical protein [Dehalococcoidia bacterium]
MANVPLVVGGGFPSGKSVPLNDMIIIVQSNFLDAGCLTIAAKLDERGFRRLIGAAGDPTPIFLASHRDEFSIADVEQDAMKLNVRLSRFIEPTLQACWEAYVAGLRMTVQHMFTRLTTAQDVAQNSVMCFAHLGGVRKDIAELLTVLDEAEAKLAAMVQASTVRLKKGDDE